MRFLQALFILMQLPVAVVFRRNDQVAYLLYLMGRDMKSIRIEMKLSRYNPLTHSSFTEIDEDVKHSEHLTARVA